MKYSKHIRFCFFFLFSLPKTLYFNFKTLPFDVAIKLPILIAYHTKIISAKRGVIVFPDKEKIRPLMVRLGFGGTREVPPQKYSIINVKGGSLIFHGSATFAEGSSLDCSGRLEIGDHLSTNRNAFISCSKEVTIGDNVMLGWNVSIFDASGHTVYHDGVPKNSVSSIKIGNHVWLCSHSQILKGAEIGNGSIVGWGSIVTKPVPDDNLLIAGVPGKPIQDKISWGPYIGI